MYKRALVWISILFMALVTAASACTSAVPTSMPVTLTPTVGLRTPDSTATPSTDRALGTPADVPVRPQKGFRAPDFSQVNLTGEKVSLSDFRGKPVLINFWATWCPPCLDELPAIQAAYQDSDDLVVLGVNFQEGPTNVKPFVEAEGLTFPVLLDTEGRLALLYRVRSLPTSFFLDPDGIITAVHIGPMTATNVEDYVAQARGK